MNMTVKRSIRVAGDGLKIATLVFPDNWVVDRFVVRAVVARNQYEVYDNLSGNLLYSRHSPELAANDVAVLNELVTKDNDHEE